MKLHKFIIFFCLALFLSLAAKNIFAYSSDGSVTKWEDDVYGKVTSFNDKSQINETFKGLIISAEQTLIGPINPDYASKFGKGAIASSGELIAMLYENPPASFGEYLADLRNTLKIAKPAYAQGVGFGGMQNLLPLWKASRNLAYIFAVIVFIGMGLAIMFRVKIDPKTAITIQNSIPKFVVALVLVTFSYAIVGLLIDTMYLLISLVILAMNGIPGMGTVAAEQARFTNLGFFDAIGLVLGGFGRGIFNIVGGGVTAGLGSIISGLLLLFVPGAGQVLGAAAGILLLIFAIIALYLIIRLFFSLLFAYIQVIISVITGPIVIMFGVLPGTQFGFGSWFSNLMANLLVFPAVVLLLLIGWLLTNTLGPSWAPPGLAGSSLIPAGIASSNVMAASATGGALTSFLGIGILLLANKIPEIVKTSFKIKPSLYGKAIGENLGAPMAALAGVSGVAKAGSAVGRAYVSRFETKPPEQPEAPASAVSNPSRTQQTSGRPSRGHLPPPGSQE